MAKEITISIPVQIDGDRVSMSRADFDRLLTRISDREVSLSTQLSLKPKTHNRRGRQKKIPTTK